MRIILLLTIIAVASSTIGADLDTTAGKVQSIQTAADTAQKVQTVKQLGDGISAARSDLHAGETVERLSNSVTATGRKLIAANMAAQGGQQSTEKNASMIAVQPQVPGPVATDNQANVPAAVSGKLYYNAMPSTPSVNPSAIKVIDSHRDIDYVSKVYTIKTKGVSAEIASYVRRLVQKVDGEVYSSVNQKTGEEQVTVIGPDYQFASIDAMIVAMDKEGITYYDDGMMTMVIPMQHRLASDLLLIGSVIKSPDGSLCGDNKVNVAYYQDSPSYFMANAKIFKQFDQPPLMVRIDAQIIELEMGDDFNFGLALDQWKEILPESADLKLDFQQANNVRGLIALRPEYQAQSLYLKGMHPKAVANMINFLLRTGHAKVLSRPNIVAINGETATIESLETVDYKAYTVNNAADPAYPLAQKTQQGEVGIVLNIKPSIAQQSMTLSVSAAVNSLVGWTTNGEPIVNRRTTTATAVLQDGELFSVSGLRKDNIVKTDERVPILGAIPFLGYLFRHEVDTKKTTEILVLLTPTRITANTSVLASEKQKAKEVIDDVNAPARGAIDTFIDRAILNKKP